MRNFCFTLLLFIPLFCLGQQQQDTLKVGYTTAPPFIVQGNESVSGINIWLWEKIAEDLQLEYEMVPMDFSEMLEALKIGDIDVCINPLTITSKRSTQMEFTHAFYASNATIVVKDTPAFSKIVQFIKGFFNSNFLKGLLALMAIITLFGLAGYYFERRKNSEQFRKGYKGIWDGLWWSVVTLTTVGYGDKAPKSRGGKITALLLMFTGLLFISGLTASIASSLTVNQLSNNPDSFNEFKDRTVGTIRNSSSAGFLNARFFKDVRLYDGVVPGLTDLQSGKIEAFIYDEPILKHRIRQDSTLQTLEILPVKFDVQFYAFGIAKEKTGLEQAISQRILEIMESAEWQMVLNEFGLTEI